MSESKKIFIAGGGTGGHIYPALAIAKAIQKIDPKVVIEFVGTRQGLEGKIIPREGYTLHFIEGGKLNLKGQLFLKLKTLLRLPLGFVQSLILVLKNKPDYVLGVGGYASGPFVLVAALCGRKTALWEPNAHPGLANLWLSKFVKTCFVVFEETARYFPSEKIIRGGMPVREEIEKSRNKIQSKQAAEMHKEIVREGESEFLLLHYGGSQGARALGRTLCEAVLRGGDWLKGLRIVHQSGSLDYADFKAKYQGLEHIVDLREFIFEMPEFYERADLVLARAGASTLTELSAYGLPSILVPLPLADGHQLQNARSLAEAHAAILIEQSQLTADVLIDWVQKLRRDHVLRQELSRNIAARFVPRAAENLAKEVLDEITKV